MAQAESSARRGALGRALGWLGGLGGKPSPASALPAGEDAVAIGSDWDGAVVPAAGMEDVRALPHVTHSLLERGWSHDAVRKVMGENVLRVLTEVCG